MNIMNKLFIIFLSEESQLLILRNERNKKYINKLEIVYAKIGNLTYRLSELFEPLEVELPAAGNEYDSAMIKYNDYLECQNEFDAEVQNLNLKIKQQESIADTYNRLILQY